ncbi:alpha/beta fold hydrolase [bacterium]|nr:MAG: alpha/beta fold hydrolase [bacterium]
MTPRKRLTAVLGTALAAFLALNAVAYRHALAMTRYGAPDLVRTPKPEALSLAGRLRVLALGVTLPRPTAKRTPQDLGLPFETLRLKSADGTGLEAWRIPLEGSRGVAVLLHGYGGEKSRVLDEAKALRAFGLESILLDFRGSGGSEGADTTVGYKEAEDVAAAAALARKPGKPLILYGKSMGAAAALRAAGVLGVAPDAMVLESAFDTLLNTTARRFALMSLPPWPFGRLLLMWGGYRAGFSPARHNPMDYAKGVRCPVLLLQGARDKYVAVADAERIRGNLAQGRLFVFAGSGHGEFLRTAPADWEREVGGFLREL